VINGIVLPVILIFILILINNKKIMGDYTNKKTFNLFAWFVVALLILLSFLLLASMLGIT
jgi:Mn2+/Fe2+ NRAMP family transporter